jgi:hypothetical protein
MMIWQNMMCILVIYYWSGKSAQTEWSIHPAKLVINSIKDDLGPIHPPIVSWTILVSQVSSLVPKCCTVSHDKPWICGSSGCPMRSPRPRLGDLHHFLFHFFGGFRGRWSLRCLAGDDGWWSQLLRGESCIPHPKEVLGFLQFWHVRYGLTMVYIDTVPNQFSSRSLVTSSFFCWLNS